MNCFECTNHCCGKNIDIKAPILLPDEVNTFKDTTDSFTVDDIVFYRLKRSDIGNCVFLDSNSKCTIYDNRPYECRIYPYILTKSGLVLHQECNVFKKPSIPILDERWITVFDTIPI